MIILYEKRAIKCLKGRLYVLYFKSLGHGIALTEIIYGVTSVTSMPNIHYIIHCMYISFSFYFSLHTVFIIRLSAVYCVVEVNSLHFVQPFTPRL